MAMAGRLRSSFRLICKILTVDSISSSAPQRSTSSLQRSLLCPSLTNPEAQQLERPSDINKHMHPVFSLRDEEDSEDE